MKRGIFALGFIILLLWWMGFTTTGTQLLINLCSQLSWNHFTYEQVSGTFSNHLNFKNLKWRTKDYQLHIEALDLHWTPEKLLLGTIQIQDLQIEGLTLQLLKPHKPFTWPPHFNFCPTHSYTLQINNSTLHHVAIFAQEKPLWHSEHINFSGHLPPCLQNQTIVHLSIQNHKSQIKVDGTIAAEWNIQWHMMIPELEDLLANSQGSIHSTGSITGPRQNPQAVGSIYCQDVEFLNYRLKNLKGTFNLQHEQYISLQGQDLYLQKLHLDNLFVTASGTPQDHTMAIRFEQAREKVLIGLSGKMEQGQWQGLIQSFSVLTSQFGTWHLNTPTHLYYANAALTLDPLCINGKDNEYFCTSGTFAPQDWAFKIVANAVPIEPFMHLFTPQIAISSRFNINGNVQGGTTPQGFLNVTLTPGDLAFVVNGMPRQLPITGGQLTSQFADDGAHLDFHMDFGNKQALIAKVYVPDQNFLSSLFFETPLNGQITLNLDHFNFLNELIPHVSTIDGRLQMDLQLGGNVAAPQLTGQFNITDGIIIIPEINIQVRDLQLRGEWLKDRVLLHGKLRSDGWLQMEGDSQWMDGLHTNLKLIGQHIAVLNTKRYKVFADPNLVLKQDNFKITVDGSAYIPEANITTEELFKNTVNLSEDVRFVEQGVETKRQLIDFSSAIQLQLGPNINLAVKGLEGQAVGDIGIDFHPPAITTAQGELEVKHGTYTMSGQTLTVREGRLFYAGNPINNPGIFFEATRTIMTSQPPTLTMGSNFSIPTSFTAMNQVTVGLRMEGTLKQYQMTLFSEPAIYEQSDILAMILFGSPMRDISGANATQVLQAASALNLGGNQFSNITKQIQQMLRLDTLGFTTEQYVQKQVTNQATTLTVGKRFFNRLYLSYSIGILENINVFRISYALTPNWLIQTQSSTYGNGGDLFYTFEY